MLNPPGYRYAIVQALRQVLDAAVRWELIGRNPAKLLGANRELRSEEITPFTGDEIHRVAVELGSWGVGRRVRLRDRAPAV